MYIFYLYRRRIKLLLIAISFLLLISSFIIGCVREQSFLYDKAYFDKFEAGDEFTFQGRLTKIEKKTNSYYLYYDNIITSDLRCNSNELIIVKSKSDDYPIDSVAVINGKYTQMNKARNEGNFDEMLYLNSLCVIAVVELENVKVCEEHFSISNALYHFKQEIEKVYAMYLVGEESGIASAITLGDKSSLDVEVKDIFQLSGLAHILAISGLHISLIGMWLYRFLKGRGLSFLVSSIVSGIVVLLYGELCGFGVSTIRAIGMFIIMLLGNVFGEAYDMLSAIGMMILVVLFTFPNSVNSLGFIFSFAAVAGIAVVSVNITSSYDRYCRYRYENVYHSSKNRAYKPSIKEKICKALLSSICIQLITLPLVVHFYFEIPVYVVILNTILLPFLGVLISCTLLPGIIGTLGIGVGALFYISHSIIYLYEFVADTSLKLPFSRFITGQAPLWKMFIYYVLLISISHFINEAVKKYIETCELESFDGRKKLKQSLKAKVVVCVLIMLVPLVMILCNQSSENFEVDMLDVDQGDGIYICSDEGVHFFVDGGSSSISSVGKYRILPYLKCKGVRRIDYWFVSHTDSDHISGLIEALESGYRIENIVVDAFMLEEDNYKEIEALASKNRTNIIITHTNDKIRTDTITFTSIFAGDSSIQDINANCLVLLMEYEGKRFVFEGDATSETEELMLRSSLVKDMENVDVLKVAHHGSKTSSSEAWIKHLSPDISLISAGVNNRYGHPHDVTLETIHNFAKNCEIYRTDEIGQIRIYIEENQIKVDKVGLML